MELRRKYRSNSSITKLEVSLDRITEKKALLHDMKFISYYRYEHYQKVFPKIGVHTKVCNEFYQYKKSATVYLTNIKFTLYYNPVLKISGRSVRRYDSMIVIVGACPKDINELISKIDKLKNDEEVTKTIPTFYYKKNKENEIEKIIIKNPFDLHIKSIEITYDFFGANKDLRSIFKVLMKYLYFPHCKSVNHPEPVANQNAICYYFTSNKHAGKYCKIYERGSDANAKWFNKKKYWLHDDCDRVRIEVTLRKTLLNYNKTRLIEDLVRRNSLNKLIFGKIPKLQFKRFKAPVNNPSKYINCECFQDEYLEQTNEDKELFLEAKERFLDTNGRFPATSGRLIKTKKKLLALKQIIDEVKNRFNKTINRCRPSKAVRLKFLNKKNKRQNTEHVIELTELADDLMKQLNKLESKHIISCKISRSNA